MPNALWLPRQIIGSTPQQIFRAVLNKNGGMVEFLLPDAGSEHPGTGRLRRNQQSDLAWPSTLLFQLETMEGRNVTFRQGQLPAIR